MITPQSLASTFCRIVIVNDVFGTCDEMTSPQTPREAVRNHGQVQLAADWCKYHQSTHLPLEKIRGFQPIACSVQRSADTVIVHWHATTDDLEAAQVAMTEYFDGTWREKGEDCWS